MLHSEPMTHIVQSSAMSGDSCRPGRQAASHWGQVWWAKRTFFDRIACTSIVRDTFSLDAAQMRVRCTKPNEGRKTKAYSAWHSAGYHGHIAPWIAPTAGHGVCWDTKMAVKFCAGRHAEYAPAPGQTCTERANSRPLPKVRTSRHNAVTRTLQKGQKLRQRARQPAAGPCAGATHRSGGLKHEKSTRYTLSRVQPNALARYSASAVVTTASATCAWQAPWDHKLLTYDARY